MYEKQKNEVLEQKVLSLRQEIEGKDEEKFELIKKYELIIKNFEQTTHLDEQLNFLESRKSIILSQIQQLKSNVNVAKTHFGKPSFPNSLENSFQNDSLLNSQEDEPKLIKVFKNFTDKVHKPQSPPKGYRQKVLSYSIGKNIERSYTLTDNVQKVSVNGVEIFNRGRLQDFNHQ